MTSNIVKQVYTELARTVSLFQKGQVTRLAARKWKSTRLVPRTSGVDSETKRPRPGVPLSPGSIEFTSEGVAS
jgi:hypothetical protein